MAIGETILVAVLQVVIDRLASKEVINFFRQSKFDQSLVVKLKNLMLMAAKLLLDAGEKQMTDECVRLWLNELQHWFHRAEEVVDQIANEAKLSSLEVELPSSPQSLVAKVRDLAISSSSSFLNSITPEVREIVGMLESMLDQHSARGLAECVGKAPERVPTTSLLEDPMAYGPDRERNALFELLLSEDAQRNNLRVVTIVAMGGVGKSTLAKMVYNDTRVRETFDPIVWVCVSAQFEIGQFQRQ